MRSTLTPRSTSDAAHLADMLRRVARQPELEDNRWTLLNWSTIILRMPKRGGKRRNMTNSVRDRIADFASATYRLLTVVSHTNSRGAAVSLAQIVSAKLEEGNVRAALRLLSSDDTVAVQSGDISRAYRSKHPPASQPIDVKLVNVQEDSLSFYDQNAVPLYLSRPDRQVYADAAGNMSVMQVILSISKLGLTLRWVGHLVLSDCRPMP